MAREKRDISENSPRFPTTIRLAAETEEAVRASAQRSGRTLTAELRELVERGLRGQGPDDDLFGHVAEQAAFNRAFGLLVALVSGDLEMWSVFAEGVPWQPTPEFKASVAGAISELLREIPPAGDVTGPEFEAARETGRIYAQGVLREMENAAQHAPERVLGEHQARRITLLASIHNALKRNSQG